MHRVLLACVAFLVVPAHAHADASRAPALRTGPPVPIQAYGRQNPECAEWTNGCVVCASTAGRAQCSTPGIACTPAGLTCRRRFRP